MTDRKRARNEDGTYKGDDPTTPDINEAYEETPVGRLKKNINYAEVGKLMDKRMEEKRTELGVSTLRQAREKMGPEAFQKLYDECVKEAG